MKENTKIPNTTFYNMSIVKVSKLALSDGDDKSILTFNSVRTFAYGMTEKNDGEKWKILA